MQLISDNVNRTRNIRVLNSSAHNQHRTHHSLCQTVKQFHQYGKGYHYNSSENPNVSSFVEYYKLPFTLEIRINSF
jgi:hypothetical protein